MSIRAKFRCYCIADNGHNKSVSFHAIYGTEGENADFAKATPSGSVSINVDKDTKAAETFKEGQDYYLDFTPIPAS